MFVSNWSNKVIVTDCEKAVEAAKLMKRVDVRSILHNKMRLFVQRQNLQHEEFKRIAGKLKDDKDIILIQTDKTNRIAVFNRQDDTSTR